VVEIGFAWVWVVGLFYCGAHGFDLFWAGWWSSWVTMAMVVV